LSAWPTPSLASQHSVPVGQPYYQALVAASVPYCTKQNSLYALFPARVAAGNQAAAR